MSKHVGFLYAISASLFLVTMCLVHAVVRLAARVEHAEWVGVVATDNAEVAELRAKQAQKSCDRTFDLVLTLDPLISGDKAFVSECEVDPFGARVCRLTSAPSP